MEMIDCLSKLLMSVNFCIGGTGCKQKAKEGWAAAGRMSRSAITSDGPCAFLQWWIGGGSLQWLLCFKQLGPAWNNYPAAWALRAQALGFAVFGMLAENGVTQDNWKPMLLNVISYLLLGDWRWQWFLRSASSSFRRRTRLSRLLCYLLL